jgi:hypothetical protein
VKEHLTEGKTYTRNIVYPEIFSTTALDWIIISMFSTTYSHFKICCYAPWQIHSLRNILQYSKIPYNFHWFFFTVGKSIFIYLDWLRNYI